MRLNLNETARAGDYLKLQFRAEVIPGQSVDVRVRQVRDAIMNREDFILAAGPVGAAGSTDFGFGYVYIDATVRLTGLTTGRAYGSVLAPLMGFGCLVSNCITLSDAAKVTSGAAAQTGGLPTAQERAAADTEGPFSAQPFESTNRSIQLVAVAAIVVAVVWLAK